ncbi:MAG: DUF2071 domain-containing protein [Verrucomicrobia bacterium]|nr:DUF2071 domain-containing protein [Verrucomicrobiota bacterium]
MNALTNFRIEKPWLHLPATQGVIDRRILVNFRVDPTVLARVLPAPFRPKLVGGFGLAGICLIRLRALRPAGVPAFLGLDSENAAHRIAVEWDQEGARREGVFIPRRNTDSKLNEWAGGRLFPGLHHSADFRVWESPNRFKVEMRSRDGRTFVRVAARVAGVLPPNSVFRSIGEASAFFQAGSLGWSARPRPSEFDGLELRCADWRIEPLHVERVESSFFADRELFPAGSAEFDSAFLMRGLRHAWHARGKLRLEPTPAEPFSQSSPPTPTTSNLASP